MITPENITGKFSNSYEQYQTQILVAVAGHHDCLGLAIRVNRNHCDFRPHLLAFAGALPDRPHVLGGDGVCELASRLLVATCGHVRVQSERGVAAARHHQSDFCRHDALHVHRDIVLDLDVHLARAHAVVA